MNSIQLINSSGNHFVQICPNKNSQVDLVTRYIKDGLLNKEAIIVIAKPALIKTLKSKMDALSFDGLSLQGSDQIRFFDAEILLAYLKSDEGLEEEAFQKYIAAPINNAQSKYRKVRAFGEVFDILWKQSQHNMLVQFVKYCKDLTNTEELALLCTYSLDDFDPDAYNEALECICKYHPYLTPREKYDSMKQQNR